LIEHKYISLTTTTLATI